MRYRGRQKEAERDRLWYEQLFTEIDFGRTAILYLRVTPEPLATDIAVLEPRCRAWCDEHGLEVVHVIREVQSSYNSATDVMPSSWARGTSVIVATDTARFTRESEMRWELASTARSRGVRLISLTHIGHDDSAHARFIALPKRTGELRELSQNPPGAYSLDDPATYPDLDDAEDERRIYAYYLQHTRDHQ